MNPEAFVYDKTPSKRLTFASRALIMRPLSPIATTKTSEEGLAIREESATLLGAKNKKFAPPLAKLVRLL